MAGFVAQPRSSDARRIGLMSLPGYHNYGSQLQLYALQSAIERLGYACEVIDYMPPPPPPLTLSRRLGRLLANPKAVASGIGGRITARRRERLTRTRSIRFKNFSDQYIHLGTARYRRQDELQRYPPNYDAYVVGSDQVWSPLGHFGDSAYYLGFAEPKARVAYAPSIGVSQIPDYAADWMREQIRDFPALSVREDDGARLIHELTGRCAEVVVDPTLLFDPHEWSDIAVRPSDAPRYVLCYALEGDVYIRERARSIARWLNAALFILPFHDHDYESASKYGLPVWDAGPREFLGLVRDASYVCTDSFHGTVFSILFGRPFSTFRRYGQGSGSLTGSRIANLLGRLGLATHLSGVEHEGTPSPPPDYGSVEQKLRTWRTSSWQYLRSALTAATR